MTRTIRDPDGDPTLKRAIAYIVGTVAKPRQGFMLILFDARGLTVSFLLLVAMASTWAIIFLSWALAALEPWTTPWISIPLSEYYFWEALFAVPVFLAAWVLAAGFVQLISHRLGGGGSFDATARLLALSIAVSRLVLLIPALVLAFLAIVGAVDAGWWLDALRSGGTATGVFWFLTFTEAVWMGMLTTAAVRAAHKLRPLPSIFVAIPTVVLTYGFVLVFLR